MTTRKLSGFDATLLVMGGIVGIGIFFTPSSIAALVPTTWAFLLLWGIGGVVALAAAFTFAELAGTWPETGGWFVFLRQAFGPFPAYLFAWVVLFIVSSGAMAAVAGFFGTQLHQLLPAWVGAEGSTSHAVVALGAVAVLTVLALSGLKNAALFQNFTMIVKLAALAMLVLIGLAAFISGSMEALPVRTEEPPLVSGMVQALLPIFFSYGGWQLVCYLAPEVKDAERTLPRIIVLGVLGVITVYFAANAAFVGAFGLDALGANDGFASTLAQETLGRAGVVLLSSAIAISALGVLLVNVITAPWLYVAMARAGLFFRTIGHVDPTRGVPTNALFLQAGLVAVYYFARPLAKLVDGVVFAEWFFHGLAALALLSVRARRPDLPRPFKSPFYPLAPALYLLCALVVVVGTLITKPLELTGVALATIAAGALIYPPWRRFFATKV